MIKLIIISVFVLISGCTTSSFHSTDAENTWLITQTNILGIYTYSDVFYCMSNKSPEKASKPTCSQAILFDSWGNKNKETNQK